MADLIKRHLQNIVEKHLKKYGFVVWYDGDEIYKDIVKQKDFTNDTLFKFTGSYYELRFKCEKYLKKADKGRLLIYLDKARDRVNYPLIEIEKAGCIIEPGAEGDKNTDLSAVVKMALEGKITSEQIKKICQKVEEGTVNIEEIERLIDIIGTTVDAGTLSIVYKTKTPQDIVLAFVSNTEYDKAIKDKRLFSDLAKFIAGYLETDLSKVKTIDALRKKVIDIILMVDFTEALTDKTLSEKYDNLKLPVAQPVRQRIKQLADLWRQREDIKEEYIKLSKEVQDRYRISRDTLKPEEVGNVETFSIVEEILIEDIIAINEKSDLLRAKKIIEKRKYLFWAKNKPEFSLLWIVLEYCADLLSAIRQASEDIDKKKLNYVECINYYVYKDKVEGWYLVDRYYRLMDSKYENIDIGGMFDDKLDILIARCRQAYSKFLHLQTNYISSLMIQTKSLDIKNIIRQKDILRSKVLPCLENDGKCAYFLVDAFRYEMGEELFKSIEACEDKGISCALAEVPTLTQFGMLSLFLYSDDVIEIKEKGNKLTLETGGVKVSNRSERIKYLEQKYGSSLAVFKLDEIIKPARSVKDKINNARFIIVTSQELDSLSESGNELIIKQSRQDILIHIKRAVSSLARFGVEKFVITADHGYLLGDEIGKDAKVENPNGEKYESHKRVWIGKGGSNPENTVRLNASYFGFKSDLDFVFPEGLACFKVTGEETNYLHGGISLQETVIPVIELYIKSEVDRRLSRSEIYSMALPKNIISNRIFTVKINYDISGLMFEETPKEQIVRVKVMQGRETVGQAETAEYGFNDNTKEISLEINKPNVITIVLNEGIEKGTVDICLIDSDTEMELKKISNIAVKILI